MVFRESREVGSSGFRGQSAVSVTPDRKQLGFLIRPAVKMLVTSLMVRAGSAIMEEKARLQKLTLEDIEVRSQTRSGRERDGETK